ncbi:MAG: virulence factor [Cyanobacteria bacterium P01_F01_bin.150]
MKLRSIETTPSPNCMKLNLDAPVSTKPLTVNKKDREKGKGAKGNQKSEKKDDGTPEAPAFVEEMLAIAGIKSIFLMDDFITLTRKGNVDWQPILTAAGQLLGLADTADPSLNKNIAAPSQGDSSASNTASQPAQSSTQNFGQVEVTVQMFREIPVQVQAMSGSGEKVRVALPTRFNDALQRVIEATGADYVMERRWAPYQPQFGSAADIAQQVVDELTVLINDDDLAEIEKRSIDTSQASRGQSLAQPQAELLAELQQPDWKRRLKAIQQIEADDNTFPTIVDLLEDERIAIRRWAAAQLGASERAEALPPLCKVLAEDKSAIVRRTAGDALADLGDPQAGEAMITALQDPSSLVRWRASRFLTELGDETAVAALMHAEESETEFDVQVEMQAAIERIESGGEVQLPMWMRISKDSES